MHLYGVSISMPVIFDSQLSYLACVQFWFKTKGSFTPSSLYSTYRAENTDALLKKLVLHNDYFTLEEGKTYNLSL